MPRYFNKAAKPHKTPKNSRDIKYAKSRSTKKTSSAVDPRLKKYNITDEALKERSKRQRGKCAICQQKSKLVIDHCHKTGHFRELLCGKCNSIIGFAADRPEVLVAAAEYVSKWNARLTSVGP
jgi:hypothetical protein